MATQMAKKSLSLGKATGWAVGVALATALLAPRTAQAQEATPTGKGIAGGVLLGGELAIAIEAAAGVTRPGAYALGALGGGLLGGVGGYFVEQSVGDAKIPAFMLAGGIALLLPATVLAFNATSYKPPAEYTEDRGALGAEPVADAPTAAPTAPPPSGGGAAAPPAQGPVSLRDSGTPRRAPSYSFRKKPLVAPPLAPIASVVAFQDNQLRLSLPAVEVRQVFSPHEVRQFGMAQREEVRIPVFQARF